MKKKRHVTPHDRRLDMIEAILRGRLSNREIAAWLSVSKTTVGRHRDVMHKKGIIAMDTIRAMSTDEVEALFNRPSRAAARKQHPDWDLVHQHMQRTGATRLLLWNQYCTALLQQGHPPTTALSYSQFSLCYRLHRERQQMIRRAHAQRDRILLRHSIWDSGGADD
jgi:hypothetical protein